MLRHISINSCNKMLKATLCHKYNIFIIVKQIEIFVTLCLK